MIKKPVRQLIAGVISGALLLSSCSAADQQKPKIGVTGRSNQESETYVAVIDAIKAAGGEPVLLEQLLSPDLSYDNDKMLTEGKDEFGV